MRSTRLATYDASGLSEGYDFLAQSSGILPLNIAFPTASRSPLITTSPLSALTESDRLLAIVVSKPLYRMHSCVSTVFMLCSYLVGYAASTRSTSNGLGHFSKMLFAVFSITSSREMPPPLLTRGWSDSTVANMAYVSFWSHVMSAFSWRPKISGFGTSGSCLMKSKNSGTVSADGGKYVPLGLKKYFSSSTTLLLMNCIRRLLMRRRSCASVTRPP
mmetsp:Transcript_10449/g.34353  ORF Transcript_10449/g.34353 Transcript_10449/m.34353 type:complete len:217 (+) Transcript_10449:617-1267(+)